MDIQDFVSQIAGFNGRTQPERLLLLIWFWHHHRGASAVTMQMLTESYHALHYDAQRIGRDLDRLAERRPVVLLKSKQGYSLEAKTRALLDQTHGEARETIVVSKLLSELLGKLQLPTHRTFLSEALSCYRVKAFRAAIVMAWIMTFDHLLAWLEGDNARLNQFNARISVRYPKKTVRIAKRDDFEELKESEIIEIANSAGLISGNMTKVLKKELDRRNLAAHPSTAVVTEHQAGDAITDLVNNVVLALK